MVDATEIFHDLCWLLECEMATLEYLKILKRTPKHDRERHEVIVASALNKVVGYCRDYGLGINPKHGRVQDAVMARKSD